MPCWLCKELAIIFSQSLHGNFLSSLKGDNHVIARRACYWGSDPNLSNNINYDINITKLCDTIFN
jgi:hypothetical protein